MAFLTALITVAATATAQVGVVERFVEPGASSTGAYGMDDQGRVVGLFRLPGGLPHAFLRSRGGALQQLDWPGSSRTWFDAINNAGVIVGYTVGAPYGGPLEYAGGAWSPFGHTLTGTVFLTGLNDTGLTVGNYIDPTPGFHGAVFGPMGATVVDYPGAARTELGDVNNNGIAVGSFRSEPNPLWRGFFYDTNAGTFTPIDMPGAVEVQLYGINDAGEVVGEAHLPNGGSRRAVHYDGTQWRVLDLFGQADLVSARDIANDGSICGFLRGYLLGELRLMAFVERRTGSGPVGYCQATPNSSGDAAGIHYQGSSSVVANDLVLEAGPCPPGVSGLFHYGMTQAQAPFGDGFLCVTAPRFRLGFHPTNAEGYAVAPLDLSAPPSAAAQVTVGSRWNFQYWFRDVAAQGAGYNTSAGLRVDFTP